MVTVATSPSPWDVPATTQTTRSNRGDFRHTQSDQGTDDTTHWGSKQKKEVTLFHRCLHCLSPPSLAQQNMTVQRPEYPWQHTAELSRQHIVTQIFQMTYCQAIDALSLRSWPTPIKPNNQASCGRPFYMRRNIHGGAYEDTSIRHLSSIQAQMQTV